MPPASLDVTAPMMLSVTPESLPEILLRAGGYASPSGGRPGFRLPGAAALRFYQGLVRGVIATLKAIRKGSEPRAALQLESLGLIPLIESCGGSVNIEGLEMLRGQAGPVIFASNHMSSLETFMLPGIIFPFKDASFVVKRSLLGYPWLGDILKATGAVALERANPRRDLEELFEQGGQLLARGRSLVLFPQSTRSDRFDGEAFNTIAVKLARRTGFPLVPLALNTRFWGNGRWIKDLGPIRPGHPVRFAFGPPMAVTSGSGRAEHEQVLGFIADKLRAWEADVAQYTAGG